jgi:hypothetical protein
LKDALADSIISYALATASQDNWIKGKPSERKGCKATVRFVCRGEKIRIPHDFVLEMIQFALPINLNIIK